MPQTKKTKQKNSCNAARNDQMIEPRIQTHMHIFVPEQENMQSFKKKAGKAGTKLLKKKTIQNQAHNFRSEQESLQRFEMDGWINCDFTSFPTVFQSYQDDGRVIVKGCVQWNPVSD